MTQAAVPMKRGEYLLVDLALPGKAPQTVGIVLREVEADRAHIRFRRDWDLLAPDEIDVLEALQEDWERTAARMSAGRFLEWLEDNFSNDIRVSDRETLTMASGEKAAAELYRKYVHSEVRPFRTHLPVFSCRAAATKFSGQQSVAEEGWMEIFDERLDDGMFVARVEGRSMEPDIPSGSLCIFRFNVTGSRQGRKVLVEDRTGRGGELERYTIKQYWSEKSVAAEGWRHERILLKPLNPEFEAWELDESGNYAVIAEFVDVLR
jgi:SOS-response transcriptional repressor LexA